MYQDPYIKTQFLDVSGINTINKSLIQLDTLLQKLTIGSESTISLQIYTDTFFYKAQMFYPLASISLETFLKAQNTFFNQSSHKKVLYTSSENISLLKNIRTRITTFVSKLQNFNTPISEIGNTLKSLPIYTDTLTVYNIPLDMNDTTSSFFVKQKARTFYFSVTYSREEHISETNFIEIRAENIKIKTHSFDSAKIIYSNTQSLSNETTLFFYF